MPFQIPTLPTLIDRVKGDMNAHMGNLTAFVRYSVLWVLSYVIAGISWGMYLAIEAASRDSIPDTATGTVLDRWCRIFGIYRVAPTFATGEVAWLGVSGATLADGSIARWTAAGLNYEVVGDYTWPSTGALNVTVRAITAGSASNYLYVSGALVELVSAPAGVASSGIVQSPGLLGGADRESDASLLARLLHRLRNPPHGGCPSDYVTWVKETPGVSADLVWPHGLDEGVALPGIDLYFTVIDSGDNGTVRPSSGQIAAVAAYLPGVKPMTAQPVPKAPTAKVVTLAITASLAPGVSSATAKSAIRRAVQTVMRTAAETGFSHTAWSITNNTLRRAVDEVSEIVLPEITDVCGAGAVAPISMAGLEYPTIVNSGITLTVIS